MINKSELKLLREGLKKLELGFVDLPDFTPDFDEDELAQVDSIVIDPHKHGLQPYGCGCILFRDSTVGRLYKHDSPYTYFSSAELHLALIDLPVSLASHRLSDMDADSESITCLRSVLMKPQHEEWSERIVAILEECAS